MQEADTKRKQHILQNENGQCNNVICTADTAHVMCTCYNETGTHLMVIARHVRMGGVIMVFRFRGQ